MKNSAIASLVYSFGLLILVSTQWLCFNATVQAKPPSKVKYSVQRQENTKKRESLVLPYAFSTDDLGLVFGVGAMASGLYQKQMTMGGTVYGGGETKGVGAGLWNYRILGSKRFFVNAIGMMGKYPLMRHTPLYLRSIHLHLDRDQMTLALMISFKVVVQVIGGK